MGNFISESKTRGYTHISALKEEINKMVGNELTQKEITEYFGLRIKQSYENS